jgi:hypothetical protein
MKAAGSLTFEALRCLAAPLAPGTLRLQRRCQSRPASRNLSIIHTRAGGIGLFCG